MKIFVKIVAYTVVALIVVAFIGLVYKFTNGFNEDFKTFYVEYGEKQILTADSKLALVKNESHIFAVRYTFDNENSEPKDYNVKIIPYAERDFEYTVDGEKYLYSRTGELTSAFGLKKEKSQFTITVSADLNLQKALSIANGGKTVVIPPDAEVDNQYPYRLVVSSYNGKVTYNINLNLTERVTDIEVDPSEIVFGG